jgi:hypothetical protein
VITASLFGEWICEVGDTAAVADTRSDSAEVVDVIV